MAPVVLHADGRRAVAITGQSNRPIPSWVLSFVTHLNGAAECGSRRAWLTMRRLTGGWDAITPRFTEDDRTWLATAKCVGFPIPQVWDAWLTSTHSMTDIDRFLTDSVPDAVVLTDDG